jgi:hypothetical protein
MRRIHDASMLKALEGKTIKEIVLHNSHGDVVDVVCTDGTILSVATAIGSEGSDHTTHQESLWIGVNDKSITYQAT